MSIVDGSIDMLSSSHHHSNIPENLHCNTLSSYVNLNMPDNVTRNASMEFFCSITCSRDRAGGN
jgi:hypothetical protein